MAMGWHIHVIDPDVRRRAQIAFDLAQRHLHAEIYESPEEFASRLPEEGAVLLFDEPPTSAVREFRRLLESADSLLPMAVYSGEPSPQGIVNAILDGALDYLQWPFDPELLQGAIARMSREGERRAKLHRRARHAKSAIRDLSGRELEVLKRMVAGHTNKEIAALLEISPRTVEIHRGNMMRKLNARSPSDAVRLAMIAGIDAESERLAA